MTLYPQTATGAIALPILADLEMAGRAQHRLRTELGSSWSCRLPRR